MRCSIPSGVCLRDTMGLPVAINTNALTSQ